MKALNDYLDDILEDGVRWNYNSNDGSVIIKENNIKSGINKNRPKNKKINIRDIVLALS